MEKLEHYFMPTSPALSPSAQRAARLIIRFNLVSIAFGIAYFFNTYATGFLMARYSMVVSTLVFTLSIFGLKHGVIGLRLCAHIFTWVCGLTIFVLAFFSGGIKSYVLPWIALVPVMALALANGRTALIWALAGFGSVVFFFNIDVASFVSPHWLMQTNNILIASLHVGLQFLILSIVYIFERQQKKLIHQLEGAQQVIEQQNDQLLNKNEVLESEIAKRTGQLVNYNQQLEQFAFMASHNLRAPIARLIGLGNIFGESQESDREFICAQMTVAARELDQVVRDINTILDIQKSKKVSYTNMAIRKEIEQVLSTLHSEIETTNAMVELDVNPELSIRSIKPYFQSIVYNLLSNALKYRKSDTPAHIKIKVCPVGNSIQMIVTDNGIGIDLPGTGDRMFGLYKRFHEGYDGKGIGLYMVKIQSEAMGGSVQVESEPGRGSVFTVTIKELAEPPSYSTEVSSATN